MNNLSIFNIDPLLVEPTLIISVLVILFILAVVGFISYKISKKSRTCKKCGTVAHVKEIDCCGKCGNKLECSKEVYSYTCNHCGSIETSSYRHKECTYCKSKDIDVKEYKEYTIYFDPFF